MSLFFDSHCHVHAANQTGADPKRAFDKIHITGELDAFNKTSPVRALAVPETDLAEGMFESLKSKLNGEVYRNAHEDEEGKSVRAGWIPPKKINTGKSDQTQIGRKVVVMPMIMDAVFSPIGGGIDKTLKWSSDPDKPARAIHAYIGTTPNRKATELYGNQKYLWFPGNGSLETIKEHEALKEQYGKSFLPFLPFDPRHWVYGGRLLNQSRDKMSVEEYLKKYLKGPHKDGAPCFAGVKLYSRTGWIPDGKNELFYGYDVGKEVNDALKKFYRAMEETYSDFPVLCHCSPSGWPPDGALVYPIMFQPEKYETLVDIWNDAEIWYNKAIWDDKDIPRKEESNIPLRIYPKPKESNELLRYCTYVQFTTSPHAWAPVLNKYKNIKFCFAHMGSNLSMMAAEPSSSVIKGLEAELRQDKIGPYELAVRNYGSLNEKLRSKENYRKGLEMNPMVKSPDDFRLSLGFQSQEWIDSWVAVYSTSWFDQIIELMKNNKNVYADCSFIASVKDCFGPTLDFLRAVTKAEGVRHKMLGGSDWFLTEQGDKSVRTAGGYWRTVRKHLLSEDKETRKWWRKKKTEKEEQALKKQEEDRAKFWKDITCTNVLSFLGMSEYHFKSAPPPPNK